MQKPRAVRTHAPGITLCTPRLGTRLAHTASRKISSPQAHSRRFPSVVPDLQTLHSCTKLDGQEKRAGATLTLLNRCTRPERSSCMEPTDGGQRPGLFIPCVGGFPPPTLLSEKMVLRRAGAHVRTKPHTASKASAGSVRGTRSKGPGAADEGGRTHLVQCRKRG